MSEEKVVVIGAGFSGLSAACFLAKAGFDVTVLEKHETPGGRARQYVDNGFVFDMGPSWYWMPDVFERFFAQFGEDISQCYTLEKLSPAYAVIFGKDETVEIPAEIEDVFTVFEHIEKGSAAQLKIFLEEAKYKYDVGMRDLVYRPGLSWTEFLDARLFKSVFQLGVFQSYASHVRKFFKDSRLIRLMEFPVLFLGSTPSNVPALYSLMTYAGLALGTWYPQGGMYRIVEAMHRIAVRLGVRFQFGEEATRIHMNNNWAEGVETRNGVYKAQHVIASADYHHVEQSLLDPQYRMYSESYWSNRVLAPSAMIYYVGVDRKIPNLRHHNLFFDAPYDIHAEAIYGEPRMPDNPLFYVCAPSVTDQSVAPAGHENLFILVPLSTELEDSESLRSQCFDKVMARIAQYTETHITRHIVQCRSYAMRDFRDDHHALRGNAYGLANTLMQTAILKPRMRSRKVQNLYFTGQLTVPGPGVPPALISGEIAAGLISKTVKRHLKPTIRNAAATL